MNRFLPALRNHLFLIAMSLLGQHTPAGAQQLLAPEHYKTIRENSSGERPYADFQRIVQFSGYSPSAGADQVANYLAEQAKSSGLSNVQIERYSSDGKSYYWAFRKEPYWEGKKGELWLVSPEHELLADFKVYKSHLGRYSQSGSIYGEPGGCRRRNRRKGLLRPLCRGKCRTGQWGGLACHAAGSVGAKGSRCHFLPHRGCRRPSRSNRNGSTGSVGWAS